MNNKTKQRLFEMMNKVGGMPLSENREEVSNMLGIDPSELEDSSDLGDMADEFSRKSEEYEYIVDEVNDLFDWYNKNIENIGKYSNPTLGKDFDYDRVETIKNKILKAYPKFEKELGYLEYFNTKEFNDALVDAIKKGVEQGNEINETLNNVYRALGMDGGSYYEDYDTAIEEAEMLVDWYDENVETISNYSNIKQNNRTNIREFKTLMDKISNSYDKYSEEEGDLYTSFTDAFDDALVLVLYNKLSHGSEAPLNETIGKDSVSQNLIDCIREYASDPEFQLDFGLGDNTEDNINTILSYDNILKIVLGSLKARYEHDIEMEKNDGEDYSYLMPTYNEVNDLFGKLK